jgi:hypothetical protein
MQLSDTSIMRVAEQALLEWSGSLADTAVLIGGRRHPLRASEQVMQLLPLPSSWAWLPLPSLPDFGVYSHAACSMSGCVAVWGGRVTASQPAYFEDVTFGASPPPQHNRKPVTFPLGQRSRQQDILLYDVHRGRSWTRVRLGGQAPPQLYGASMVPVGNNQILLFGGTDGAWVGRDV